MSETIDFKVSGQLPGEALVVAMLNYATTARETMSQANRDNWDNIGYIMLKNWHNYWVGNLNWPGEKIK